jgi:phage gp36-like protein
VITDTLGPIHSQCETGKCKLHKNKLGSEVDKNVGPSGARSEAYAVIASMLRSWVRIPFKACMFVLVFLCCVVLSCVGRGLCDLLSTRPNESYRVSKQY